MKKHVIVLSVIYFVTLLFAQAPDTLWTKTFGGPLDDFGMSMQQTSDSGYIITGWTESFGSGNVDVYLIKTNASGDTVWTRTYGGTSEDGGNWVEQTSDGGYIITGHTYSYGAGMFDVYLIKTDAGGDTMWTKTYGGYLYDQGWSVQETPDGGYIIVGFTASFGDPLYDVYLLKTDGNGDILWTRTYGGALTEWCNSVQVTTDSGYILAGYTGYFNNYNVYLVKTNQNGDILWTKVYGGTSDDYAWKVQQTSDGGYIVVGWTESYGAGDTDIYLIKTDASGDSVWTKTYGGPDEDKALWVQEIPGKGYIIAGSTFSYGAGGADVYLIKTDINGDTLWTKTYGGADWDRSHVVRLTPDGGYIITGYTSSFGAGGSDVWLLKTESDGGIEKHQITNFSLVNLEICPNPFSNKTDIRWQIENIEMQDVRSKMQDFTLIIYDVSGRIVRFFDLASGLSPLASTISWHGTDDLNRKLPSGVYLLKFKVGDYSATEKLLLIR